MGSTPRRMSSPPRRGGAAPSGSRRLARRSSWTRPRAAKREVFEAKPVDKEAIQEIPPGSGGAQVGRRRRGAIGIA
eukprot:2157663-Pyramimonas_sp.AAC.1